MLRESRGLAELTAELYEILVHLLAEAITLPVLQERLLTLEAYLLDEGKSVLVLQTLLRCAGMESYIEVEVFFPARMLDSELGFSGHRTIGVEHLVALLVKHRGLGAADIVFEVETCSSVAEFGLPELGILLLAIFYFCHKYLILCKDNPGYKNLKIAIYTSLHSLQQLCSQNRVQKVYFLRKTPQIRPNPRKSTPC